MEEKKSDLSLKVPLGFHRIYKMASVKLKVPMCDLCILTFWLLLEQPQFAELRRMLLEAGHDAAPDV